MNKKLLLFSTFIFLLLLSALYIFFNFNKIFVKPVLASSVPPVQIKKPEQKKFEALPEFTIKTTETNDSYEQNKFKMLKEKFGNDDIIGYLKIDGTTINYPVMQSENNKYYLDRNIDKHISVEGSIFLDFENRIKENSPNTVIYGHNMNKDYMFHALRYFKDYEFFKQHRYITFDTLYANQKWEIFSFYKTDIHFNYIKTKFIDNDDFNKLLTEMKNKSLYDTNVNVSENDKILTLSTCSNQEENTRLVINAKLVSQVKYIPNSALPY